MNRYDVLNADWSAASAMGNAAPRFTIVTYASDGLFSPEQSYELQQVLEKNGLAVRVQEYASPAGHDAFLIEQADLIDDITVFLGKDK